jgi:FkbM family methyltransferase
MKKYFDKIKNVILRIKIYRNWYVLVWPLTRLLPKSRVIKTRSGILVYVRDIFGSEFAVLQEIFSRDDYGFSRVTIENKNPIILDIGANIGIFSIFAAHLYKNAKIFAYEPGVDNFNILVGNIQRNNLKQQVFPYRLAIAAKEGEEEFFLSPQDCSHSLIPQQIDKVVGKEKIICTTLAAVIERNGLEKIDFLKIDIEGAEYEVLYSLSPDIYKKISYLALEIHNHHQHRPEELLKFLDANGFTMNQSPINKNVFMGKNRKFNDD